MADKWHTNPTRLPPVPDGWRKTAIEDLCQNVTSGGTPLRSDSSFYQGGVHSWFKTQELRDSVLYQSIERINDRALAQTSAKLFPKDTVLMAMYGDGKTITSLGILAREAATNQACCAMIPDRTRCEPRFLFYALMYHRGDFMRIASGGAQRNLSGKLIRHFALNAPPVEEQRAIAHILSTLDDKIELNRRMNETLEAMARALFKSWFVDFEPVRAKAEGNIPGLPRFLADLFPTRLVDSELGKIPEGWAVRSLGDLLDLAYGKALKAEDRRDGDVPVYGSNGQVGWHDERLAAGPGIVVGRKGNPGVATWAPTDFFVIDTAFYVVPKATCPFPCFLFHVLHSHDLAALGADSAVPGLNRNLAYMSTQLLPSPPLLAKFDAYASAIAARGHACNQVSRSLAALRDTLLPKVISGELRVKAAERIAADVV